jgi:sedoheptulokinase
MLLGIDIGTTKTAAVIVAPDGAVMASASATHQADLPAPVGRSEQDGIALLQSAWQCIRELPVNLRAQVQAVGVTGQMHGVLLLDAAGKPVGPLVTWQDQRCLEDSAFLTHLSENSGYSLSTGHGCATLAWLGRNGAITAAATSASTIADLAVMCLCGQSRPLTDPTNAAAWGAFDLRALNWDMRAVHGLGLRADLLPGVRPSGSRAGRVCDDLARALRIPAGAAVAVAIGDNQASLTATVERPDCQLALTLGTGGQVSAILPPGSEVPPLTPACPYEYRPFPGNRTLVTGASLCGGAAWAWLANSVQTWQTELGQPPVPVDDLYRLLNELGLTARGEPVIEPSFAGERHCPSKRGVICSLSSNNFSLGQLARGLARGILQNLHSMLPAGILQGRDGLVGSGNALRRNPLLRVMAQEVFGLPLKLSSGIEEASVGAALNARSAM